MSCEIHGGPNRGWYFCNTADVEFGNLPDISKAEEFYHWCLLVTTRDPRALGATYNLIEQLWLEDPDLAERMYKKAQGA